MSTRGVPLRKSGCALAFLLALAISPARAALPGDKPRLPDIDVRTNAPAQTTILPGRAAAIANLRTAVPNATVDLDGFLGTPQWVKSSRGFLTGPGGSGAGISAVALAGVPAADPHRVTKAFLQEHRALFGHGPEVLTGARANRDFITPHNGMRTAVWQQQVDNIPVFESLLISHTTRNGELVSLSSRLIADPDGAANAGTPNRAALLAAPPISAAEALAIAATDVGDNVVAEEITSLSSEVAGDAEQHRQFRHAALKGPADTRLVWLPVNGNSLRLCWDVILMNRVRGEMYRELIDVQTGQVLVRRCLTEYLSNATYRVYTNDSPSPFSPGHPTPLTNQPPLVPRALVTTTAYSPVASPEGWLPDGVNETLGNNVDAHVDSNDDDLPDLPRPQGSPFRVFDFPLDLTQDPLTYSNASVVQLFFLCNWYHDALYDLGFTEAAGNFQVNNFGRGGFGNDPVLADVQDGGGFNNANFSTPPDGSSGRMQMYIFNGPNPRRDGDLDAEIVFHEHTHGLSNRRVGGGVGLSASQSMGMGEGWSDFYALSLLSQPGDDVNGNYAAAGYATYLLGGLTQNYYFGIRRYPYSTDMTKNPLTFKDIDPTQFSTHPGIPRSPLPFSSSASEVHNQGEVWCVTLWDVRANLVNKYGFPGNLLTLQIVTDAMNLTPPNPTFLQARDAIVQADLVDNGGANRNEIWAAFAKRGMGFSATSPPSTTTTGLVEAYDVPDDLRVKPGTGLTASGPIAGPFTPACQSYSLTNAGTTSLNWVAYTTQPWVGVNIAAGSLAPGGSNSVNVCLTPAANGLGPGNYSASVVFSNTSSGVAQLRAVTLAVTPPRIAFYPLDTDPGWPRTSPWAFGKPAGLGGTFYGKPDPTNGATGSNVFGVNLNGDYSTTVGGPYYLTAGPFDFTSYTNIQLQFQRWLNSDYPPYVYQTIDISTNGSVWTPIWTNGPGQIAESSWNRVSYGLPAFVNQRSNIFVRWGHRVGSSGAFPYSGWNIDDVEFLGSPVQQFTLTIPTNTTEGAGLLIGTVTASIVPSNNLVVTLISSAPSQLTVQSNVTILAGQSNATFNLMAVDDALLDGAQMVTVTATAAAYTAGNANITVFDNETATLTVQLPATMIEGQGTAAGTVLVSAAPAANITVSLSSSDTTELQVPATVIIPSGQTSVGFTATVVDDTQIDGAQQATVTAHVQNWTDGVTNVTVLDNENSNLVVTLPFTASEAAGVIVNGGQVAISGTITSNLTVTLTPTDPTRMTVPTNVMILAGQTSAAFNLTVIDNSVPDGPHTAGVIASAGGFANGSSSMTLYDNDPHHFAFSAITSPQVSAVPFLVTITAKDSTNGTVQGFNGSVSLSGAGDHGPIALAPTNASPFVLGQWSGNLTVGNWDSNIVLTASDTSGHTGTSGAFNVSRPLSTFISAPNRVDMVPDPVRGILYITSGDRVLRYSLISNAFLSPFIFGSQLYGIDISPDNNTLVVADRAYTSNSWVWVVDLPSGSNYQASFPTSLVGSGTSVIAFGSDGAAMVSSGGLGRLNLATNPFAMTSTPYGGGIISASGDRRTIAQVNPGIDPGSFYRYDVPSQTVTGSTSIGWFLFEVAANRDGTQFALPTYYGTFILDSNLNQVNVLGTYASEGPIGLAYHPTGDLAYFAWWPTTFIRAYESHTWAEVARYDCGYAFGWTGNGSFGQGRLRSSIDGNDLFVTVSGGVRWISRPTSPPAELALGMTVSPNPGDAKTNLTYTISITNNGPNSATDARVFDRLPAVAGMAFVSANSAQGPCTLSNGLVTCTLNPLPAGSNATITIVVTPANGGVFANVAAIVSSATDANPTNNSATLNTTVRSGVLAVSPAVGLDITGPVGGPFAPTNQLFALTNTGNGTMTWSAGTATSWLNLSNTGGTLTAGASATVGVSLNGTASGLPRGTYSGSVNFSNQPTGAGNTSRNFTLTINTAPAAQPQTVTLAEDSFTAITLQGTDLDSDALTAVITALPPQGTLYQTSDGVTPTTAITSVPTIVSHPARKVIYVLSQHGFGNGYGNFQFKVNDGLADSPDALVTVNVTHVNHAPSAGPDSVAFLAGTPQVTFGVLSNDVDVDSDALTIASNTTPARGMLTLTNAQFTFRPNPAFTSGQDQFNYTISDGHGGTAAGLVTIKAHDGFLKGGDWPTFGNGPSHTGYYPGMLGSGMFVSNWATNIGLALNQAAVGAGRVYVTPSTGFSQTFLTALDATNGQQAWRHDFVSAFSINPPTYDSSSVYVQRGDHNTDTQLWRINSADGATIWSAPHSAQWERYYAPTVFGDGIWVDGGYFGGMYGFNSNGTSRFFVGLPQYDSWTPTYYQGTVYSYVAGSFGAYNPVTGASLWSVNVGGSWYAYGINTISAIDGGLAFVSQPPNLQAIDIGTHFNVWTAPGGMSGSPAVAGGVVYGIMGDTVQAFAAQNGAALGGYRATNDGLANQPIVTDDTLFTASASATYVFNLLTHQLVQTIPYGGTLSLANGRLYITGPDGWVRCYVVNGSLPAPLNNLAGNKSGNAFALQFNGLPGWTYRVQYTASLSPTDWHDLGPALADVNGLCQYQDSPPTNAPTRYYRFIWP